MRKLIVALCVGVLLLVTTFGVCAQTNDAWIPGLASLVIPGAGQLINDQMDRAIIHFGVGLAINVGTWVVAYAVPFGFMVAPIGGLVYLGWAAYSAFDAYGVAKDQNFQLGLVENGIGFAINF